MACARAGHVMHTFVEALQASPTLWLTSVRNVLFVAACGIIAGMIVRHVWRALVATLQARKARRRYAR